MSTTSTTPATLLLEIPGAAPVANDARSPRATSQSQAPSRRVRLVEGEGEPITVAAFRAGIVEQCLDMLAMLGRHRFELPLRAAAQDEARIPVQLDAIQGAGAERAAFVLAWWERAASSSDPWKAWAAAFALGSCGGPDAVASIDRMIEHLPKEESDRWRMVADAVSVVPTIDGVALGRHLLTSARPQARAIGLDLLSRAGRLAVAELKKHLRASEVPLLAAAAAAASRDPASSVASELLELIHHPDVTVAWEAARALTVLGREEPCEALRRRGPPASTLGPLGVELLVMKGEPDDIGVVEMLLQGHPMSSTSLASVARLGNVTTWSFLLHYVADPDLSDTAVRALQTLFGPLVPPAEVKHFTSWKAAIAEAGFDPKLRYRGGRPWQPGAVVQACLSRELSRQEITSCLDELGARTGHLAKVDVHRSTMELERELSTAAAAMRGVDARWMPGAWKGR